MRQRNAWLSFERSCKDFIRNHKAANYMYQDVVQDLLTSYKAIGWMQHETENPLSGVTLEFFSRKSRRSLWRTRWKISQRHYGCGKAVPRQVDLKYFGRMLLDTEVCCILTPNTGESHMPAHVTGTFLPVSWVPKVLFCTFKFLCIFKTLTDRKILYTYLNSAYNLPLSSSIKVRGTPK